MYWIRRVLLQKVDQQVTNLENIREFTGNSAGAQEVFEKAVTGITEIRARFRSWDHQGEDHSAIAATFRGWEGTASRYYFEGLAAFLPESYRFKGRSKRPAYDPFNALLNYLYGMLYAYVELALMKAGLDPYNGVLHADEYNRPALVFDVIELYRWWAEWTAFVLCRKGKLTPEAFVETEMEGVRLVQPGKGIVVDQFIEYLNERTEYKGKQRRRQTQIDLDAVRLAGLLRSFSPTRRIL